MAFYRVGDVEVARAAIVAPAPRVAKPVGPDLVEPRDADERVRRRARVRRRVHVDAKHLAEQPAEILPGLLRVVAEAAVAHAEVQVAVGSEGDVPAVVVAREVLDLDDERARRVGDVGVAADGEPANLGLAGVVGVAQVEDAARLVVGREGQPEQALLAAAQRVGRRR
jgi:hypothetical protein